jgi:hypothetical protein
MVTYDLYGSRARDMDQLRIHVETALGLPFEARWSDLFGGDYFLWRSKDSSCRERLTLIRNHHLTLGDYFPVKVKEEPEFAGYRLLLRVERSLRGNEIKTKLATVAGLDFLRRIIR